MQCTQFYGGETTNFASKFEKLEAGGLQIFYSGKCHQFTAYFSKFSVVRSRPLTTNLHPRCYKAYIASVFVILDILFKGRDKPVKNMHPSVHLNPVIYMTHKLQMLQIWVHYNKYSLANNSTAIVGFMTNL